MGQIPRSIERISSILKMDPEFLWKVNTIPCWFLLLNRRQYYCDWMILDPCDVASKTAAFWTAKFIPHVSCRKSIARPGSVSVYTAIERLKPHNPSLTDISHIRCIMQLRWKHHVWTRMRGWWSGSLRKCQSSTVPMTKAFLPPNKPRLLLLKFLLASSYGVKLADTLFSLPVCLCVHPFVRLCALSV